MRNCAEPLLGNQFTGFAADAVSSVFNSEEGVAQVGYKLELTLTKLSRLLPIEHSGGFLEGIEGPRGIGSVISIAGNGGTQGVILPLRLGEFLKNQLLKFLKLFFRITNFFHRGGEFTV